MKQRNVALSAVLALVVAGGVAFAAPESEPASETAEFALEGGCCDHCDAGIVAALKKVDGVTDATASHKTGKVTATFDPDKTGVEALQKAVAGKKNCSGGSCSLTHKAAGEKAEAAAESATKSCRLDVQGMHCGGCAARGQRALESVKGVKSARVSFPDKEAVVEYDANETSPEKLIAALEATKLQAKEKKEEQEKK
jgi:copper chaperone CopZ